MKLDIKNVKLGMSDNEVREMIIRDKKEMEKKAKMSKLVEKLTIAELREFKRLIHEQLNQRGHLF